MSTDNRREVSTRKIPAFQKLAQFLVKLGLTPNQVSIASSVFAAIAGFALFLTLKAGGTTKILFLILAIAGIQLRLICNLIDGLMAVEGGLKTKAGEIFNEVPDRISDTFILVSAGYAALDFSEHMMNLAWLAALLAVSTAYVRVLGASMTGKHDFSGPMAKQHRMFLISLGCLGGMCETSGFWPAGYAMGLALALIAIGSLLTCANRLRRLYLALQ